MYTLKINGRSVEVDVPPEKPLLWVLRENLGLTGTKFGCGIGACGACTVLIDDASQRSCLVSAGEALGGTITTIEGLAVADEPGRVQAAWLAAQVPQCGYCQPGFIMAVEGLLRENPSPTDADLDAAITNICRCGTYPRVRAAVAALAGR